MKNLIKQTHNLTMRNSRTFTSLPHLSTLPSLQSWFITGFSDAEATFTVSIKKDNRSRTGWQVQPTFSIGLHIKDLELLNRIQCLYGVGTISIRKDNSSAYYYVSSIKDLTNVIIPHFDKYPLITQKRADFELFKSIVELMNKKEHLSEEGLHKIVGIRASLNKGLSDGLKSSFPDIVSDPRLEVWDQEIKDPHWLAGFVSGDGSFMVKIHESSSNKVRTKVSLNFHITQHSRDQELMMSLVTYLDCGQYAARSKGSLASDAGDFIVRKFSDIEEKILPFFDKYSIQGAKALDYADFKKVAEIMKVKTHLTEQGLEQIRLIKSAMNSGRFFSAKLNAN